MHQVAHSFPLFTFSFSTATNYQLATPCTEGKLINNPNTETIMGSWETVEDIISFVSPCMKMLLLKLFFFEDETYQTAGGLGNEINIKNKCNPKQLVKCLTVPWLYCLSLTKEEYNIYMNKGS